MPCPVLSGTKRPGSKDQPLDLGLQKPYEIMNVADAPAFSSACGVSHRAFLQPDNKVVTLHQVDLTSAPRVHYHKFTTEIFYFVECGSGAGMELDGVVHPMTPGTAVLIRPGTRHRATGQVKLLVVVVPAYDKTDEYFE